MRVIRRVRAALDRSRAPAGDGGPAHAPIVRTIPAQATKVVRRWPSQ
ncbi:hypothetical protein Dvina_14140 [Dactylosporangium vinaceum]|uniref:Uncharacterized protein n=1 Tax=Dactylosporangium vinaceum TaxID=53362 RepID=A0ABV5MHN2_9ACTN|nr:hypothetical protein [Dactylosporangium vinaceum]UAB99110.1 hypothetical protein Dvina_14140 [Dactylosporangium vinaceum]